MKLRKLFGCLFAYILFWGVNNISVADTLREEVSLPIQQEVISTTHIIPLIQFDGRVISGEDLMITIRPDTNK
tara:strand:- start:953 stop:1171 length:219 start_codon:yes stop_codon:yes gene_type:complete